MKKLIDLTTLTKGAQPKSNLTKKLLGLVGVASASIFLSFPVWASLTDSASDLNQLFNQSNLSADGSVHFGELLAQNDLVKKPSKKSFSRGNPTTGGGRTTDWTCLNNPNPECPS